ncbi:hypothetical protein QOL99_15370, partial [Deinococcus sp. MIMF12]
LSPGTAAPGTRVQLQVQTQGAREVRVEAFGQVLTPALEQGRAEVLLTVPAATPPGSHDVVVTVSGEGGSRTTTLKLVVVAAR